MADYESIDTRPGVSEGTPYELEQLEPSPVEETPSSTNKQEYPFPLQSDNTSRSTSRVRLTSHGLPYYLHRAQKYSTYAFSLFTIAHITNTSLLPLATQSVPASSSYLLLTRPYYQSVLTEPLLITIPLATHIASGVALRLHRRNVLRKQFGAYSENSWPKLSGTSALGYTAIPLVLGHSFFTRILPLWVDGGSSGIGLDYVGHGVALHPWAGFAGFVALIGVAATHMVWGGARWLGFHPEQVGRSQTVAEGKLRRKRRWWVINFVNTAVAGLWIAGGVGIVAANGKVGGWVGKSYDELFRRVPLLGNVV